MIEQQSQTDVPEQDPLSGAAEGLEPPKFPLLAPDRVVRFRIAKATYGEKKDDATRFLLTLQLKTTKDESDSEGNTLHEGFTVYHRIGMSPSATEGRRPRTWENIKAECGVLLRACGFPKKESKDLRDNPAFLEGAICDCRVGISKAQGNFPESNSLRIVEQA